MSKNCIAIEYNSNECRIIQAKSLKDSIIIEKAVTIDSSEYANLGKILSAEGFNLSLPAIITADPQKCHFSNIDANIDTSMPEDETDGMAPPINLEDAIRIHLPGEHKLAGHSPSTIIITTQRSAIDTVKELADNYKIKCKNIQLMFFALIAAANSRTSKANINRLLVYIAKNRLIVIAFQAEEILLIRNIILSDQDDRINTILLREIQLTWRAAFGEQVTNDASICIMNGKNRSLEIINELKTNIPCEITGLDINDMAGFNIDISNQENYIPAVGAAMLMFSSGNNLDINLLKSIEQATPQHVSPKQIIITNILAVVLATMLATAGIINNISLNNQHKTIENNINTIFEQTLPAIKSPGQYVAKKKLAIMEELLSGSQSVYQLYDRFVLADKSVISVMQELAGLITDNFTISAIDINENILKLTIDKSEINTEDLNEIFNKSTRFKVKNYTVNNSSGTIELEIIK